MVFLCVFKYWPIVIGSLGKKKKSICVASVYSSYLSFYLFHLIILPVASCAKSQKIISCEASNENFESRILLWSYLQVMCAPQLFIYWEISHSKCFCPLDMLPLARIFGIPKLVFITRFQKWKSSTVKLYCKKKK